MKTLPPLAGRNVPDVPLFKGCDETEMHPAQSDLTFRLAVSIEHGEFRKRLAGLETALEQHRHAINKLQGALLTHGIPLPADLYDDSLDRQIL